MWITLWLSCAHTGPPALSADPQPSQQSVVWHKAREQYVLGILYFDKGACDEGAKAMRTAMLFDAKNEWLQEEARRLLEACEEGR